MCDLLFRIPLTKGDELVLTGLMHWTHHDLKGRCQVSGSLKYINQEFAKCDLRHTFQGV